MIFNRTRLCAITIILSSCLISNNLFGRLTTLQHYDPAPIFSANDSMMPPNSQFLDLIQARYKNETPSKNRIFGFNISGFIQGANQAAGYTGNTQFGTISGIPENGFEMGDFRGTLYAMGVFLGKNPANGNNIWVSGEDDGLSTNITPTSIQNFNQPSCLQEIAMAFAGTNIVNGSPPPAFFNNTGLVFNLQPASPAATTEESFPSIFHADTLAEDTKYFGAFSIPIEYRKQGARIEINFNCSDFFQFTVQGGVVNIKQSFTNTIATQASTSTSCAATGQTAIGPYSLSALQTVCPTGGTTPQPLSPLYASLNISGTGVDNSPNLTAQSTFNEYLSNNLDAILDPVCGINQALCSFDDTSIEDFRFIATFQRPFDPNRAHKDDDEDDWPDMIFTPYLWLGGTFPIAKEQNYNSLLSLPFGNNGHPSMGTGLGMTFDFAESVEVGFEGGMTYFFPKEEYRPFPTHPLQRVIYPFRTNVLSSPGMNWHLKALLSAYQFLKHVSFWFTYEFIEHTKDSYKVCNPSQAQYFYPEVLSCTSDWRGQFFNAALVFDIQPGLQASLVWQQPISPRNAYYPVSILGSINFMF